MKTYLHDELSERLQLDDDAEMSTVMSLVLPRVIMDDDGLPGLAAIGGVQALNHGSAYTRDRFKNWVEHFTEDGDVYYVHASKVCSIVKRKGVQQR